MLTPPKILLFCLLCGILAACSKPEAPQDPGNPNNPSNPNNPNTAPDKNKLKGWWTSYKKGSQNTPAGNGGYNTIYLGNDSFYLQSWFDGYMPGEWLYNGDSIWLMGARSKVQLTGDTLIKFYSGIYSQYYIRKDTPLIVNNSPRILTLARDIINPSGVVADASGNIYFTEPGQNRIRKIATDGTISLVAGSGTAGFAGDGGPATAAKFDHPTTLAIDASGNLYVTDNYNKRVRKITASNGYIATVAGNGTAGIAGDGGQATSAQLRITGGIAVDNAGNIYLSDNYTHYIRKVDVSGIISTIAGTGIGNYSGDNGPASAAALNEPGALATDGAGNLYICDRRNNRIRKILAANSQIITIAGDGTAGFLGDGGSPASARFFQPDGLAVDNAGNIYISDTRNNRIRKITISTNSVNTIAGTGHTGFNGDGPYATWFCIDNPVALVVDNSGNVVIADQYNSRIRKLVNR